MSQSRIVVAVLLLVSLGMIVSYAMIVTLPSASSASLSTGAVVINVESNGKIILSGQAVELSKLPTALRSEIANTRIPAAKMQVLIRAHEAAPFPVLTDIMKVLGTSGITQITFSADNGKLKRTGP